MLFGHQPFFFLIKLSAFLYPKSSVSIDQKKRKLSPLNHSLRLKTCLSSEKDARFLAGTRQGGVPTSPGPEVPWAWTLGGASPRTCQGAASWRAQFHKVKAQTPGGLVQSGLLATLKANLVVFPQRKFCMSHNS